MRFRRGRGTPSGVNSPRGAGTARKWPPWLFTETGMGNYLPHGCGDGGVIPDRGFPVAIFLTSTADSWQQRKGRRKHQTWFKGSKVKGSRASINLVRSMCYLQRHKFELKQTSCMKRNRKAKFRCLMHLVSPIPVGEEHVTAQSACHTNGLTHVIEIWTLYLV
jgi:hypothetical protein